MPNKQIYLVRHAQALYDPTLPDAERPLTPVGQRQAAALAGAIARLGIEEIHTSPYQRCVHTITPLSGHLGVTALHVADLRERAFTNARVPDWATTWRTAWMDPDFAYADGESGRQAQVRIYDAMTRIAATSRARTLAVSSHGNVIALLLHRLHSAFTLDQASAIRNPDVFRLTYDGTALRWDDRFAVAELDAFATTFGSD